MKIWRLKIQYLNQNLLNLVCRINRRLGTKEEKKTSELEELEEKSIQNEIQRKNISLNKKAKQGSNDLQDETKQFTIYVTSVAGEGERKEGNNNLFE